MHSFQTQVQSQTPAPDGLVDVFADGAGTASLIGAATRPARIHIDLRTGDFTASFCFVSHTGNDSLCAESDGSLVPTEDPDVMTIVEILHWTGGTGRFDAATGNGTATGTIRLSTLVTDFTYEGTVHLPTRRRSSRRTSAAAAAWPGIVHEAAAAPVVGAAGVSG